MEVGCSVKEDEREIRYMAVTLWDCLSLLILAALYTHVRKRGWLLLLRKTMPAWYCSMVCRAGDKNRVGTLSESSTIATGPLKLKLVFQICSVRKTTQILCTPVMTPKCVIWRLRVIVL